MKLEDIKPAHCHARARRLLADVVLIRDEMGRSEDARPVPEITGAQPREVYFETLAAWQKVQRLSDEVGARSSASSPLGPDLREVQPGHVLQLLDAVLATTDAIKARLGISEQSAEPAIESSRQPSDVLTTVLRINRELSRALERPFTPTDVFRVVSLASTYATSMGGVAEVAPFERRRKPADCYARLSACLLKLKAVVAKRGTTALDARGIPKDVLPGDVYDVASLVLGELAFLHASSPNSRPVHAFEPVTSGHMLPAHVDQLARTLETQISSLA